MIVLVRFHLIYLLTMFSRIYIWNPNEAQRGQEMVGEFPSYNQWSFDLDWCHRDPSLVAVSSVDGCISVYSLLGAGSPPTQSDKVSALREGYGVHYLTVII